MELFLIFEQILKWSLAFLLVPAVQYIQLKHCYLEHFLLELLHHIWIFTEALEKLDEVSMTVKRVYSKLISLVQPIYIDYQITVNFDPKWISYCCKMRWKQQHIMYCLYYLLQCWLIRVDWNHLDAGDATFRNCNINLHGLSLAY